MTQTRIAGSRRFWKSVALGFVVAYALCGRALPFAWSQLVAALSGPEPAAFVMLVLRIVAIAAALAWLGAVALAVAAWRSSRRQVHRRWSLLLAFSGLLHVAAHAASSLWLGKQLLELAPWGVARDAGETVPWDWLVEPSQQAWLLALVAIDLVAWSIFCVTWIAGWWRLPATTRRRIVWLFDASLGALAIALAFAVPLTPASRQAEDLYASTFRLLVTALAVLRLVLRGLPWALKGIERSGFASLVAARHMQARKTSFLAAIAMLSIMAVSFSSCALVTTLSVMGGFRDDLQNKILGNHAHLVVDHEDGALQRWQPWLQRLRTTPGIVAATPYVSGEVMVTSSANLAGAVLRGIDAASVGAVTDLPRNLRHGSLAGLRKTGEDGLAGVLLGQELARSLRVDLGDEVNVVSPLGELGPSGPLPKSKAVRVAGIFYSGMYEYDMKYAYMLLDETQRFFGKTEVVSGLEAKVQDVNAAASIAERLRRQPLPPGVRVRGWQELNQNLFGALALEKLAMFVTLGIAVLVAGFCVFGTLTLLVQEKYREVAILGAMGSSPRGIMQIFITEGLMIGGLGAALGLGLGFVVCFAASHFGIRMNPEVYYIDRLPVHIDIKEFLSVAVAAVAVCLLATLFPAYLAGRTRPSEALRYE